MIKLRSIAYQWCKYILAFNWCRVAQKSPYILLALPGQTLYTDFWATLYVGLFIPQRVVNVIVNNMVNLPVTTYAVITNYCGVLLLKVQFVPQHRPAILRNEPNQEHQLTFIFNRMSLCFFNRINICVWRKEQLQFKGLRVEWAFVAVICKFSITDLNRSQIKETLCKLYVQCTVQ